MSRCCAARWSPRLVLFGALALVPAMLFGNERPKGVNTRIDPSHETVALFDGIDQGQFEVKLIVKDSTVCRLMVKNLTDRPLNVRLPDAFAGVPVLAQFQNQGGQQGMFGNNMNQAPQQIGGGGQQNGWPQGNGIGNGMGNNLFNVPNNGGRNNRRRNVPFGPIFNIAPEKVGKFKLACVCLEHGKPTPKARYPYEIKPIESVTQKAEVREICAMLGRGEIGQKVAQAAAWHFNNAMSWKQLEAEHRSFAMGRVREPYFNRRELAAAKKAVEQAEKLAKERKKDAKSNSLSSK